MSRVVRTRSGTFPRPGVSTDDGVLAGVSSIALRGGGGGHAAVEDQWDPGRWKRGKLLGSGAFGQVYLVSGGNGREEEKNPKMKKKITSGPTPESGSPEGW